jgi:hypothetical protein
LFNVNILDESLKVITQDNEKRENIVQEHLYANSLIGSDSKLVEFQQRSLGHVYANVTPRVSQLGVQYL